MARGTFADLDLDFLWGVLCKHAAERRERERKMPSKSPAQKRFMAAAAHSPKFAKAAGVPVAVAKEFVRADQGRGKPPAGGKRKGK
jgi:hypothetical protein